MSAVRRVLEETVTSQLQGKAWQGEEEAVWTISLTETIKARVKGGWPVRVDFRSSVPSPWHVQ